MECVKLYETEMRTLMKLPAVDCGMIFQAIAATVLGETAPELSPLHEGLYDLIYSQVCRAKNAADKHKTAGNQGGRPRNVEPTIPDNKPTANQVEANHNQAEPNHNQTEPNENHRNLYPYRNYNGNYNGNYNEGDTGGVGGNEDSTPDGVTVAASPLLPPPPSDSQISFGESLKTDGAEPTPAILTASGGDQANPNTSMGSCKWYNIVDCACDQFLYRALCGYQANGKTGRKTGYNDSRLETRSKA